MTTIPVYCISDDALVDIMTATRAPSVGEDIIDADETGTIAHYRVLHVSHERRPVNHGSAHICRCEVEIIQKRGTVEAETE